LSTQNAENKFYSCWHSLNVNNCHLLGVYSRQMHDTRFPRSTGFNEVPWSKHNSPHTPKHYRSIWMFHGCFHNDTCSFG